MAHDREVAAAAEEGACEQEAGASPGATLTGHEINPRHVKIIALQ
jgi:hypothetical protein